MAKILIVAALLAMLLAGGAGTQGQYIDGVYQGRGDGYSDYIDVEVIIEEGLIKDITVTYFGDTRFVGDVAIEKLREKMLAEQTIEVDTISQATFSSQGFIEAVKDALKDATRD
jgi:uncharacterized protein with FMN-binding domain